MVAFDTAKVERALRGPLGDEAARDVTEALAAGMTENLATKSDLKILGADLRSYALRLAFAQIVATIAIVGIATAVILNSLP